MDSLGKRIKNHWSMQGKSVPEGNSELALRQFEEKHGVRLPSDLREYLATTNGMAQHWSDDQDDHGFSFWPLERFQSANEETQPNSRIISDFPSSEDYYIFADYLGWSWAYAINLNCTSTEYGHVVIVGGIGSRKTIANTFSEFVDLYLTDSPLLYFANE